MTTREGTLYSGNGVEYYNSYSTYGFRSYYGSYLQTSNGYDGLYASNRTYSFDTNNYLYQTSESYDPHNDVTIDDIQRDYYIGEKPVYVNYRITYTQAYDALLISYDNTNIGGSLYYNGPNGQYYNTFAHTNYYIYGGYYGYSGSSGYYGYAGYSGYSSSYGYYGYYGYSGYDGYGGYNAYAGNYGYGSAYYGYAASDGYSTPPP